MFAEISFCTGVLLHRRPWRTVRRGESERRCFLFPCSTAIRNQRAPSAVFFVFLVVCFHRHSRARSTQSKLFRSKVFESSRQLQTDTTTREGSWRSRGLRLASAIWLRVVPWASACERNLAEGRPGTWGPPYTPGLKPRLIHYRRQVTSYLLVNR